MIKPGERINKLLNLGAEHPYFAKAGTWYHRLKRFPAILIDNGGYIRFETEEQYHTTPGIRISKKSENQVNIAAGISSLLGYRPFSDAEITLISQSDASILNTNDTPSTEKALRRKREIDAIIRNQKYVDEIKKLYKNTCQLCGERIQVRPGKYYSEVHHIRPLGKMHDGPDSKDNMICVCPNHHTILDFFAIRLEIGSLIANKHSLNETYIDYHNQCFERHNRSS